MANYIANPNWEDNIGIDKFIRDVTTEIEAEAKRQITKSVYETPPSPDYRRTGNARRGIGSVVEGTGSKIRGIVWGVAGYSKFIELGTKWMNPRPFLRPALKIVLDKLNKVGGV